MTNKPAHHLLAIATMSWLCVVGAQAQTLTTFVSGRGKDGGPCSASAPCQTLQAALNKTLPGGQIQALDSANYGAVTINKSVSIISGGTATGVLAPGSVPGVTIAAGANDIIELRGLVIDGAGSGSKGLQFVSGASLNMQDSVIRGFVTGIDFQPTAASTLVVSSTLIANNLTGISLQTPASIGVLNDIQVVNNGTGIAANGTSSAGLVAVTVQNSIVANNGTIGVQAAGYSAVMVTRSTIANNAIGVQATSANSMLRVADTTIAANGTGWAVTNGGQVVSASGNSIGGNVAGNTAPPTSAPPPAPDPTPTPDPTPAPTMVSKNIVTDFGAKCDGATDDAPAFMLFNRWARTQVLPITLTVPSGVTCSFQSAPSTFAAGLKALRVIGYGAKFTTTLGSMFLGGFGVIEDNTKSSRFVSSPAGASSVKLLASSEATKFTVGQYVLLTGGDLQGYGYPPNPWVFEYSRITDVNQATGLISLSNTLQNEYKSTWPSYQAGSNFVASMGGPATIYALDPSWDTDIEYRGLTISGSLQTYAIGRKITFIDVKFQDCGNTGGGFSPTQSMSITAINVTMLCQMEVDKLVSNLNVDGGVFDQMLFQSSSTSQFTMKNATVATLNGTPQATTIENSSIDTLIPGALGYGRTTEISCSTCKIGRIRTPPGGVLEPFVDKNYTMNSGIITVPNSRGPSRWAVPGANAMFAQYNGNLITEGYPFRILDISQDATNTYIKTSLTGGFPLLPTDPSSGLNIYVHPAPKFTCSNCTGSLDAVDLSQAPPGAPLFSFTNRTYAGSVTNFPRFAMWGTPTTMKINVLVPYTGVRQSLTLYPFGAGGAQVISGGTSTAINPAINLRIPGEREILAGTVIGAQPGDSIRPSGSIWLANTMGPYISDDISQEPPSVWPSFKITIATDQGVPAQ